jgi:copper(I)-binding protein
MKRTIWFALLLGAFLLSGCNTSQSLAVKDAWAKPGDSGGNSAIYFLIENPTSQDDILLSASTDVAASTELHISMMDENGVMSMQPQESVPVPAQGEVEFKAGGLHVMLINLNRDLKVGDTFTVTLNFQNVGAVNVEVAVKEP